LSGDSGVNVHDGELNDGSEACLWKMVDNSITTEDVSIVQQTVRDLELPLNPPLHQILSTIR